MQIQMKRNNQKIYLEQYRDIYNKDNFLNKADSSFNKNDLVSFYKSIKNCTNCNLSKSRTNLVFGTGNPNANIVFVGEAPGKNEDLEGKPFVGRSGKLLDKILAAINLNRDDVYILNVLKCRPPENRNPLPSEIQECEPYLKEQLNMILPKVIVSLGRISAMTLLKSKESLTSMRNKIHSYNGIDLIVTYHPAALLRNPNFKKDAWEDFQLIRDKYL